jgi:1-acyl-sn-glycerol-3-phosphate acyltransferase
MHGLSLAIAATRSAATYVAVALYVLLVAPPGMLIALLFRAKWLLYWLGHAGVAIGMKLSGIRCSVSGLERVPRDKAVVFCSNHQSNIDPPLLFTVLHRRLHVLFKSELQKLPLLGRAFVLGGFIPIARGNRAQSSAAIEQGVRSLAAGNSFLIFPEGTRSHSAEMLPFKKGGFMMAIKAQAPVVPVAIQGGRAAMARGSRVIRPVTVRVKVGEPIETSGMTLDDRDSLARLARVRIEELLAE